MTTAITKSDSKIIPSIAWVDQTLRSKFLDKARPARTTFYVSLQIKSKYAPALTLSTVTEHACKRGHLLEPKPGNGHTHIVGGSCVN